MNDKIKENGSTIEEKISWRKIFIILYNFLFVNKKKVVDDTGLEPVTSRTSSGCSTS